MKSTPQFVFVHVVLSVLGFLALRSTDRTDLSIWAMVQATVCFALLLSVLLLGLANQKRRRATIHVLGGACGFAALAWDMMCFATFCVCVGGNTSLSTFLWIAAAGGALILFVGWRHRTGDQIWELQVKSGRIDSAQKEYHPDVIVSGQAKGQAIAFPVSLGPAIGIILGRLVGGNLGLLFAGALMYAGFTLLLSMSWTHGIGIINRLRREEADGKVFIVV